MALLDSHEHQQPEHEFDGIVENRENPPPVYFNILFYGLILWAAAFIGYYLTSGWSSEKEFRQEMAAYQREAPEAPAPAQTGGGGEEPKTMAAAPADAEADHEEGQKLFATSCAVCHGPEGKGGIGPDLTADTFKYGRSVDAIAESISNGRPGGMPAFGNQLSAAKISSLARFVESL